VQILCPQLTIPELIFILRILYEDLQVHVRPAWEKCKAIWHKSKRRAKESKKPRHVIELLEKGSKGASVSGLGIVVLIKKVSELFIYLCVRNLQCIVSSKG